MKHTLKTWPPYFAHVLTGAKTFEVRRDDRPYQVGDEVELVEWDRPSGEPTGRSAVRRIVYILGREEPGKADAHAFGLEPGFVVLGVAMQTALADVPEPDADFFERVEKERWQAVALAAHSRPAKAEAAEARIAELEARLAGEVCDGEHEGPCPAWHDGVDGLRQRIAELEAQLAFALPRITELEAKLAPSKAARDELREMAEKWQCEADGHTDCADMETRVALRGCAGEVETCLATWALDEGKGGA